MPARRVPDSVRWALIGAFAVAFGLVVVDVWPAWSGCPLLVLVLAGVLWIGARDAKGESQAPAPVEPTPEQKATREAESQAFEEAYRREVAEHERVEAVLRAVLERANVRFEYSSPKGGHMDKRDGTYTLTAPLAVTAADLAALNGPITRFESVTAPDGRVSLTRLSARDRHWGGIEVHTPDA